MLKIKILHLLVTAEVQKVSLLDLKFWASDSNAEMPKLQVKFLGMSLFPL